jgi:phospholipase/carboxylesterase
VPALDLPDYQFLLPDAPFPHPQVSSGKMWYDLAREDYWGLAESQQTLIEWLTSLESQTGVPLSSTFLLGFSQGGAMVLDVGLTLPLAGLISLSGYLHRTPQEIEPPVPPLLIVHGRQDPVVPIAAAQQLRDYLLMMGTPIQYKEFDIGHEISAEVLELVQEFILVNTP